VARRTRAGHGVCALPAVVITPRRAHRLNAPPRDYVVSLGFKKRGGNYLAVIRPIWMPHPTGRETFKTALTGRFFYTTAHLFVGSVHNDGT
jgi:hypothetical protein